MLSMSSMIMTLAHGLVYKALDHKARITKTILVQNLLYKNPIRVHLV